MNEVESIGGSPVLSALATPNWQLAGTEVMEYLAEMPMTLVDGLTTMAHMPVSVPTSRTQNPGAGAISEV